MTSRLEPRDIKQMSPEERDLYSRMISQNLPRAAEHFAGIAPEERLDCARANLRHVVEHATQRLGPPACVEGCHACCIYTEEIGVLPEELTRIVDLVEQQGRAEEVATRAEARAARGHGACPLLGQDGRCTIYSERPLSCRWHHSYDLSACNAQLDPDPPLIPFAGEVVALGNVLVHAIDQTKHDLLLALGPMIRARQRRQARIRKRQQANGKPAA